MTDSRVLLDGHTGELAAGVPRVWFLMATASASLAAAGSLIGLMAAGDVYGRETTVLADAAAAQDWVNLLLVAPMVVVLGRRARLGSLRAHLTWLGCLAFTVYNYAIYAFSIHFGPLFLVWLAVLGTATFALIGGLATVDWPAIGVHQRPLRGTALFLIGAAALFALLWLSEIVPDLLAGDPSRSAADWRVPTNPVHVLDLAFFLPALATSGFLLLRRRPWGYATAPGQLTWLALTCLPILVTPMVAQARGHEAGWAVTAPIGLVLLATLVALARVLGRMAAPPDWSVPTGSARAAVPASSTGGGPAR